MTALSTRNRFVSRHFSESRAAADDRDHQNLLITGRISPDRQIWTDLIDDLLGLRSLENDWDGQGSIAPDRDLVDSAIKLAHLLRDSQKPPAHYATASVAGTIHLEWVGANRSLDFEVIAPGVAEVCQVDLTGPPVAPSFFCW